MTECYNAPLVEEKYEALLRIANVKIRANTMRTAMLTYKNHAFAMANGLARKYYKPGDAYII